MKRRTTREEVLLVVQNLIARDGISAVRVDEIAQRVGISKRTLYELFEDKNSLVGSCLDAMTRQQQRRIAACRRRRTGNPLQQAFRLTHEYIDALFAVERTFLIDIRRKAIFAERCDEHRECWQTELTHHLESAREQQCLLPEIDVEAFADQLIGALFELRLNLATREEIQLFNRTMIRGAATRQGIELIDSKPTRQS